ncbi:MAG: cyclic nucleotide-binding domain-containing protein [Lentisphaeraceae bacterium]|nr:cyclic nucleotide-binding domain-containing protein [Lentisphaeraceae bacterium]
MQQIRFKDFDKLKEMLSKVELFSEFSRYDLPKVAELCDNVQFFNQDEPIINKGVVDDSFFILLSGTARVCKSLDSESLFTLEPGCIFGEISFLSNTERTKYIIANENVFALQITSKMLQSLEPEMRDRIKDYLIQKLVGRIIALESDS